VIEYLQESYKESEERLLSHPTFSRGRTNYLKYFPLGNLLCGSRGDDRGDGETEARQQENGTYTEKENHREIQRKETESNSRTTGEVTQVGEGEGDANGASSKIAEKKEMDTKSVESLKQDLEDLKRLRRQDWRSKVGANLIISG
jgi:hypothetical protein